MENHLHLVIQTVLEIEHSTIMRPKQQIQQVGILLVLQATNKHGLENQNTSNHPLPEMRKMNNDVRQQVITKQRSLLDEKRMLRRKTGSLEMVE